MKTPCFCKKCTNEFVDNYKNAERYKIQLTIHIESAIFTSQSSGNVTGTDTETDSERKQGNIQTKNNMKNHEKDSHAKKRQHGVSRKWHGRK